MARWARVQGETGEPCCKEFPAPGQYQRHSAGPLLLAACQLIDEVQRLTGLESQYATVNI